MNRSRLIQVNTEIISGNNFYSTLLHSFNYLASKTATKALGFISIPILTRLLTPADYGINAIYHSWIPILIVLLTLNTFSAVGRYYYEEKKDFGEFIGATFILVFSFLIVVSCYIFIFKEQIANLLGIPDKVILFIIPSMAFAIVGSVFGELFQARRESKVIAITGVIGAYVGLTFTIVLAYRFEQDKYMAPILSGVIISGGLALYYMYRLIPFIKFSLKKIHLHYIFMFTLPMVLNNLSGLILERFDIIMIGNITGASDAGLYSFAYTIGMLLWLVVSSLYMAWMPDYFRYMNNRDYAKHDADTDKLVRIIFLAASVLILFGKDLGVLLAKENFHASLGIVPLIVGGYIFLALHDVYKRHIVYSKRTIFLFIAPLTSGIVNIALNVVFIPRYGYVAAAYTTLFSYLLMASIAWFIAKYIIRIHSTPLRLYIEPFILLSVVVAGHWFFINSSIGFVAQIGLKALLIMVIAGLLFRNYADQIITNWTRNKS